MFAGFPPPGWVRNDPPPATRDEAAAMAIYTPPRAAAPLLAVCRLPADRAAQLARATGQDPAAWFARAVADSMNIGGLKVDPPRLWSRTGVSAGQRLHVKCLVPEGDRGKLEGEVVSGRAPDGSILVVAALSPPGRDLRWIETALANVPLEETVPAPSPAGRGQG
ncbi:MAG: hypothetical protein HYU66_00895 [Armatimonadetes bacterium]|nr:hypothetical protein [Armatimonadota bacterium]